MYEYEFYVNHSNRCLSFYFKKYFKYRAQGLVWTPYNIYINNTNIFAFTMSNFILVIRE